MRVLVIEQDRTVVDFIRASLGDEHEISVENDSLSGFARVVSAEKTGDGFQVVICEAHMAGIDGPDLFAALRARRDPPSVLVLDSGASSFVLANADAVLKRPFAAGELTAVVQSLIAQRATAKTRSLRRIREICDSQ